MHTSKLNLEERHDKPLPVQTMASVHPLANASDESDGVTNMNGGKSQVSSRPLHATSSSSRQEDHTTARLSSSSAVGRLSSSATEAPAGSLRPSRSYQAPNFDGIDSKLYDREREVELLKECFQNACKRPTENDENDENECSNNSSIVLITGESGIGKSALARSLETTVEQDGGGWFLHGKCDQQIDKNQVVATVPYAPFAEAFGRFVDHILTQVDQFDEHYVAVRKRLQTAILEATEDTTSVGILTDVIPALKKLMVSRPSFSRRATGGNSIGGGSERNHFALSSTGSISLAAAAANAEGGNAKQAEIPVHAVFVNFLHAFCSKETPLVLLLDDLQWLETSSLFLFQAIAIAQHTIEGFLLIGTCRGNEVDFDDPLSLVLRTVEDKHNVAIQDIALQKLSIGAMEDLVQDVFSSNNDNDNQPMMSESTKIQVAEQLFQQANGNCFCVLQALRNLIDSGLLMWNLTTQQWELQQQVHHDQQSATTVSSATLCSTAITNLIDLEAKQHQDQGALLEKVLMVASCLGTEFSSSQMDAAVVGVYKARETRESLDRVLLLLGRKRWLLRREDQASSSALLRSTKAPGKATFRWKHDRFQHAAYSLIDKDKRADFHVSIGLNLLRQMPPLELQNHPFVAVHQFCRHPSPSSIQFQSEMERTQLVALCLGAGERAGLSSAFEAAATYLRLGLSVSGSPASFFAEHYDLSLSLYNAAAEMECCRGNFFEVDNLVATIFEHTKAFDHQLRAYETHIYSMSSRQDLDGAIRIGLTVLRRLGEKLPRKPSMISVVTNIFWTKYTLSRVTVEDVLNLKPLNDWRKLAAMRIIQMIFPACLRNNVNLSVLLAIRAIEVTLKHGLSDLACIGFGAYGLMLCNPLGFVDEGIRIVKIGKAIQELLDAKSMKCRTEVVLWGFSLCWKMQLHQCIDHLNDAARIGFLSGDPEMATLALYCSNCASFLTGAPLLAMEKETFRLNGEFSLRHQENLLFYLKISQQTVQNLRGLSKNTVILKGAVFDEDEGLLHARNLGDVAGVAVIRLFQCLLAVYFNDPVRCRHASKYMKKCSLSGLNASLLYQAHFAGGLADVIGARSKGRGTRLAGRAALKNLGKFARDAPENVLNKIFLIQAEKLVDSNRDKAMAKFKASIDFAKEQNLPHEEALAYERTGLALLGWGDRKTAASFLVNARELYEMWGSPPKVEQLSSIVAKAKSN